MAVEVLDRTDHKKDTGSKSEGLLARMLDDIADYLDTLDEKARKKAEQVVVPTNPTRELLVASWDAAADATNSYAEATRLATAGSRAQADALVNAAKAHFANLPVDVRSGALFVLQVQAEQEDADRQATR